MLKLKLQYFGCLIQRALLLLLFSHLSHHSVNAECRMHSRTAACQASMSFIISWSLFKLKSIELVMPFSQLSLCHPLLLLPSIFPSIRVFPNESTLCIRWPNYWRNHTLTVSPFVNKVLSLLFNTLFRFVITFLLISWLQSLSIVILEPKN